MGFGHTQTRGQGFPGSTIGEELSLPIQETHDKWVGSLGREDPLEKEMATNSSILALRIPWMEESGGSIGSQRV